MWLLPPNMFWRRQQSKQEGFTLVEMLVAMALFTVVAFIVTTLFITITAAYRRAQAAKFLVNDISFTLEGMVSRLKDGREFQYGVPPDVASDSCPALYVDATDTLGGCTALTFKTRDNTAFVYRLQAGQIERCDPDPDLGADPADCGTGAATFKPITSAPPIVTVTGLSFKRIEQTPGATEAERMLITITAESKDNRGNTSKFQVRSTVTPFNM